MIPGPPALSKEALEYELADMDRRAIAYCLKEGVILKEGENFWWSFADEDTKEVFMTYHTPTGLWGNGEGEQGHCGDLWFAVDVALQIHRGMEQKPVQKDLFRPRKRKRKC